MNFKKSWKGEFGITKVISDNNSSLSMIEVDMIKLADGDEKTYNDTNIEYGIVILGGKCSISGEQIEFTSIGKRKNVFDGPATAIYIPRNRKFTITSEGEFAAAVCKFPAEKDFTSQIVNPEDVIIKDLGKDGWKRQAHFIMDERIDANLLYIGEAYVNSGMWASYPPHKHDDDNMPVEGILEEVYYFEFDKPQGFGIQKVYSKEGDIDETYTVKTGDFIEIPKGYHPFSCAPGYDSYYLWIMAGKNRGFFMSTDEEHKWLTK